MFVFDDKIGFVKLVDKSQVDAALKIVNAARISYKKQKDQFDDKDAKLIKFLHQNDHGSPFRHSWYTFHIKAPLATFRQWLKYQVSSYWKTFEIDGQEVKLDELEHFFDTDKGCSWNEVSGRYVQIEPEFYFPSTPRSNPPHGNKQSSQDNLSIEADWREQMIESCNTSYKAYESLINKGVAKEIARMILPQNIYSEAYWTVSLAAVIHFLDQRLKPDAQFEIRKYAQGIKELIKEDLEKIGYGN